MKKDKPTTDKDDNKSDLETEEMTTLFSSDNTEITDFTRRMKRAIRGEEPEQRDSDTVTDLSQGQSVKQGKKSSRIKNNVVNLFKPK